MKRSSQVALLLMGVTGVGAGAYAMMPPPRQCTPAPQPGAVQPGVIAPRASGAPVITGTDMQGAVPLVANPCPPSRSSSGSGGSSHWSRPIFRSSPSSTTATVARTSVQPSRVSTTSSVTPGTVARGGFGSTGRGFSSVSS